MSYNTIESVLDASMEGIADLLSQIDEKDLEIERLRAALLKITKSVHGSFDDAHVMADIARRALESKDD